MNFTVDFNWKLVLALGAATGFVILSTKATPVSVEKVLTNVFDTANDRLLETEA